MSNVETTTNTTKPRGKGNLGKATPKSTFNPLATKVAPMGSEAIAQAYRDAFEKMEGVDEAMQTKVTEMSDEEIMTVVRSKPGQTSEDLEGERFAALVAVSGVTHEAPAIDVAASNAAAEHDTLAAKDAEHFPEDVSATLRAITGAKELQNISALVVRQGLLSNKEYGQDWLRSFPRIGYVEGKDGMDGRKFNTAERYATKRADKKGEQRTVYVSHVENMWNRTPDGKAQLEMLRRIDVAKTAKNEFSNLGDRELQDEKRKWKQRNVVSIQVMRDAIHIEQIIQDLETCAPNVVLEIKHKVDKDGEQTNEIKNSQRPIIWYNKGKASSYRELAIREFLRCKPYKAVAALPQAKQEAGANMVQLEETFARKTQPNKGQGEQAGTPSVDEGGKANLNAREVLNALTVGFANYFDQGETEQQRREYNMRMGALAKLLTPKGAEEDLVSVGDTLTELNLWFSNTFSIRYSKIRDMRAQAGEEDAAKTA